MTYFVPDFNLEGEDPASGPNHSKSHPQSHDEDKLLRELLWDQGPVVRQLSRDTAAGAVLSVQPPGSDVGFSQQQQQQQQQLFMEEDEMFTWLHQYNDFCGDMLQQPQPQPSSRASSCRQVVERMKSAHEAAATATVTRQGSSSMATVEVGKVFDSGSVEASVGCSTHVSDRKRKVRPGKDSEFHNEDVEVEYGLQRKEVRHSTLTRTRAAEVHNLSERRRRDRINEKMKALQELIPRCNKSDKASMLDDAIEYLKLLQLQVQMLSTMQYNMAQMMFPDTQMYLQAMGFMGMGMGMASGGIQRPVMPFGPILPYPPVVGPSSPNLRPQPMPSFHQSDTAVPNQGRAEAFNQQDPASNSINVINPNMVRVPNFADLYHHYAPIHHLQVPSQGQTLAELGSRKESDGTK